MKSTNEIISNLKKHQSSTPSKWRENAEWRIANKSWLRYSQHIAMMMLDKMEELKMKPAKKWDGLMTLITALIVGALFGLLFAKMGL